MALTTQIKDFANRLLRQANLRLETLTANKLEARRLLDLAATGYFEKPAFPLLPAFQSGTYESILAELPKYRERFDSFANTSGNDVGYSYENGFYTSPDAEVLYTMVRKFQPRQILEIGCGNSTRISRQAIIDGNLATRLVCIDPCPRTEIQAFADEIHLERIESPESLKYFQSLEPGDFLFIDSSHELHLGNDCVFLYLRALREVKRGVIIHIHDIFLPWDYPARWKETHPWSEQYLVQCILEGREEYEVLWPTFYLGQSLPDFSQHFPNLRTHCLSTSLWLRQRMIQQ
jgi:predicted O-methyltransferase YrrM